MVTAVSWGYRGITEKTMETTIPALYIYIYKPDVLKVAFRELAALEVVQLIEASSASSKVSAPCYRDWGAV